MKISPTTPGPRVATRVRRLASAAAMAGVLAASGPAPSPASAATTATTTRPTVSSTAWKGFPQQLVTDVATGRPFDLGGLAKTGKPVLIWFWAPT